ncbi:cobalamin biosynthesis protein [Pseudobacteriovorax antillogorgiicola]|uniref:Cobalamin biosynthesis protein CobD n=1 Tax=Pseudobacteriovorax antillogorgiicola TaxID=1513793 RepID=A0A1Y6C6X1_9BACT|nr:cobalamin biosynthesis protein [Pseudobacteriovorax antillogorgiicola]TCS50686.1 adenosylcobinamide-phosphate synthase [Pseudobacteriovorax antillogorgiicola]SMF40234.1 adenosylcobinamide-phosphate synthase [Pseudobacteriovorax antillogorgiicola]
MNDPSLLLTILALSLLLDQVIGEYPNRWHPVVWIGRSIRWMRQLVPHGDPVIAYLWGLVIALFVPAVWAGLVALLSYLFDHWPWLWVLLGTYVLKASFALEALGLASKTVGHHLDQGQLEQARFELRSLCSRDASQLSEEQLIGASVSSIAENLSDSFVAPLFYFLIFGLPGAIAYRAINTLDAMLGYWDERRWIGHFSAKLDDLVNYVPARITALLITAVATIESRDSKSFPIMIRDHFLTPSPNGGWPMAAMAGALGIQLSKPGAYKLGDPEQGLSFQSLGESWRLAKRAGLLFFGVSVMLLGVQLAT